MKTALLIIDVQQAILQGVATPDRQAVIDSELDRVSSRLGCLKAPAEAAGMPVVLVQHDGDLGHRLAVGAEGWRFRPEIAPSDQTIIVHKRSCDSFHETDLQARLEERGIDRLIVGGCMTQFCVDTTVRRAVSNGCDVVLVEDGHATSDFGVLTADQIVAHHNRLLSGFDAGSRIVTVAPAAAIRVSDS